MADSVEVSYSTDKQFKEESERFAKADKVFVSKLGLTKDFVTEIEIMSMANGLSIDHVIVIGEKNFGCSYGQIYCKRNQPNYFEQYIDVESKEHFIVKNNHYAELYVDRFINLMNIVLNDKEQVRVFTPIIIL